MIRNGGNITLERLPKKIKKLYQNNHDKLILLTLLHQFETKVQRILREEECLTGVERNNISEYGNLKNIYLPICSLIGDELIITKNPKVMYNITLINQMIYLASSSAEKYLRDSITINQMKDSHNIEPSEQAKYIEVTSTVDRSSFATDIIGIYLVLLDFSRAIEEKVDELVEKEDGLIYLKEYIDGVRIKVDKMVGSLEDSILH